MAELYQINVHFSEGQKRKLAKAYRDNEEVSIRISHSALSGSDALMVPNNTVKRVAKSLELGKGVQIKISKANVRKQTGQGIFTSLMPVLRTVAPTVGKTLGLSALAGLASEGASQLVKKITGGQVFQVPNKDLFRLAMMSGLLNKGQIRDLAKAHQNGSDMLFRLTQKQVGNGIGSIIASIGIPMILDAIRGKGVGRGGPRVGKGGPRIGPPPFIGTWSSGRGKKKKDRSPRCRAPGRRARSTTRKKQSFQGNTISGRHIVALGAATERHQRPVFKKTVPMSNFDPLEWCKYLKIPIKNVLSRDETVPHNHKLGLFICNLEPSYMSESYWVATYVKDNVINYFDSFGMPPFQEILNHAKERNLTLLHQNQQIQNLYTTTCRYFCLYFLNEMHKSPRRRVQGQNVDYFDLLQVFSFDTNKNEKFIENYFRGVTEGLIDFGIATQSLFVFCVYIHLFCV